MTNKWPTERYVNTILSIQDVGEITEKRVLSSISNKINCSRIILQQTTCQYEENHTYMSVVLQHYPAIIVKKIYSP